MLTRLNRTQAQAQTRKRILVSARTLLALEGFHASSVERIAEAAGYSKGAVYSNFVCKEDILLEAVGSWLEEERETLAMALAQHRQLDSALAAVARLYAERLVRGEGSLGAEIRLAAARRDELGHNLTSLLARHQQQLVQLFATWSARCDAPLAMSVEELARLVSAASCGLLLESAAEANEERQAQLESALYRVLRCCCRETVGA